MPRPSPAADFSHPSYEGLVARLDELIAVRPKASDGFAPGGKVRTHQLGGHRSSFRGHGMEFDEVRAYQPGDDVRTIDWRVTARTGRTHTKLFQEERERPVLILLDARSPMRFGTRASFKSVLAAKAAAVLTWLSMDGGDLVGGIVITPREIVSQKPERTKSRMLGFLKTLAGATQDGFDPALAGTRHPGREPSLAEAIGRLRRAVRPGALVFIVSDFHDFGEEAQRELSRLSHQCRVTNVLIFDPLEAEPPSGGIFPMSDGEEVAALDGDNRAATRAYAHRFDVRLKRVEALSHRRGMTFLTLQTGQDPADLLKHEQARAARGGAP